MKMGHFSFPPTQGVLRKLRADVRAAAAKLGASPALCERVALVIDELVNNAIEHGVRYRCRGLDLAVEIGSAAGRFSVEFLDREMPDTIVKDLSAALSDVRAGMPSLESERGRGLFLLSVYLDDLRVEVAEGGGMRLHGLLARN